MPDYIVYRKNYYKVHGLKYRAEFNFIISIFNIWFLVILSSKIGNYGNFTEFEFEELNNERII